MGGIIGPRQTTLAKIRKYAACRIEIVSQPRLGTQTQGALRIGPAPPHIVFCFHLDKFHTDRVV